LDEAANGSETGQSLLCAVFLESFISLNGRIILFYFLQSFYINIFHTIILLCFYQILELLLQLMLSLMLPSELLFRQGNKNVL